MALESEKTGSDRKPWALSKMPFWQPSSGAVSASLSTASVPTSSMPSQSSHSPPPGATYSAISVAAIAKSFLPTRRRLRLDPANKLYFPYEPGKQVRSAIEIKNVSKSHVAFKFQTTNPKSCYMRPPGEVLAPGESIIATGYWW